MKNKNIFSCWLSIPFHWFFLFSFNWPKINFSNFRRVGNKYIPRHFSLKTWIDKISHYSPRWVTHQNLLLIKILNVPPLRFGMAPNRKIGQVLPFVVIIEVAITYKLVPSIFLSQNNFFFTQPTFQIFLCIEKMLWKKRLFWVKRWKRIWLIEPMQKYVRLHFSSRFSSLIKK